MKARQILMQALPLSHERVDGAVCAIHLKIKLEAEDSPEFSMFFLISRRPHSPKSCPFVAMWHSIFWNVALGQVHHSAPFVSFALPRLAASIDRRIFLSKSIRGIATGVGMRV